MTNRLNRIINATVADEDYEYNNLSGYGRMPQFPVMPSFPINEKVVLAKERPDSLINLMYEEMRESYRDKENQILSSAGNTFANIYATACGKEHYKKIKDVTVDFVPETKSFWGNTVTGRGIKISLHKFGGE